MKTNNNKKKILMWYKVKELDSKGLNKSQISRSLNLYRTTVRRYLSMNEEDFYDWIEKGRNLPHKLQGYYDFIKGELEKCPSLSASQIEDRLKECYENPPLVHSKTVYNFVQRIRNIEGISKHDYHQPRVYEKLAETNYGHQAQVDFGEYWMNTKDSTRKKVYFFVLVLCRSRYKFVYFQDVPFTAERMVIAHQKALEFIGGSPKEILYDQDRVLVVKENLGDIILTKAFSTYCKEAKFKPVFCRKSDPESKGKVENVVGFVKKNFLKGRVYESLNSLNASVISWLSRTGNGKEHSGIKKIPFQEWLIERPCLSPLKQLVPTAEPLKKYLVRKDNTISYKSNFYTLPLGTYSGLDTYVLLKNVDEKLYIYDTNSKLLTTHPLSLDKGSTIRNADHRRDKSQSLPILKEDVLRLIPDNQNMFLYLELLEKDKSRYFRENLVFIKNNVKGIATNFLDTAVKFCLEKSIFNANQLIQIATHYQSEEQREQEVSCPNLEIKSNNDIGAISVKTSKINTYEKIISSCKKSLK